MPKLLEMLSYRRPEGSDTQKEFCRRFLEPVFGLPDRHGNFTHIVYGDAEYVTTCFTSHHDTVHHNEGIQKVIFDPHLGHAYTEDPDSNCLGADCTTGIWLMLEMIEAGVPGVYCVFAGEESGCVGSTALLKDNPYWLDDIDVMISFDRYGLDSIITHQASGRTASDDFAKSLAEALDMDNLKPDPGGIFTDSYVFSDTVNECTNLSVGYYNQHTKKEYQDTHFALHLVDKLINADWSKLVVARDPDLYENLHGDPKPDSVEEIVWQNPYEVAELLESWGFTAHQLNEALNELDQYKKAAG